MTVKFQGKTFNEIADILGIEFNRDVKNFAEQVVTHMFGSKAKKLNDIEDFAKRVKDSEFLHREGVTETQDAYVDMDDPTFPIIPEVYGNKSDEDAYLQDILRAVSLGETRFDYDENAYITVPEVRSDDPELLKYQSECTAHPYHAVSPDAGHSALKCAL